jgi:hypothetical protein
MPRARVSALGILECWREVRDNIPLFDRALVSLYDEVRPQAIRGLYTAGAAGVPALPRLRALTSGTSAQAYYARRTNAAIEAAMIRP